MTDEILDEQAQMKTDPASAPETVAAPGDVAASDDVEAPDETAQAEGSPASSSPTTDGFGAWVSARFATVAVGAVAVALAVMLILALLELGNQHALSGARTSALAAARTDTTEVASYDYRHLERDFGVVAAHSTPSFRRSFEQSTGALRSTLTRFHATATATVVSAGIVSASTSRAVVLVFLDQRVANTSQTAPSTDRSEIEITLVRPQSRWLIDQVTLL